MNEAEQLRDRALRECFRVASATVPGFHEAHVAVRAVSEERRDEARVEALRSVIARGLGAMPWAFGRAFAARLVAASLVDPLTIDEPAPSPAFQLDEASYLDERALDALLAVYTRHVAALAGGPLVP
jgi:hypothetical protein